METIKTAFVVVLLLAVLYGVYVVLTKPEPTVPPEMVWVESLATLPEIEVATNEATGVSKGSASVPAELAPAVEPPALVDTAAPAGAVPVPPVIPKANLNAMPKVASTGAIATVADDEPKAESVDPSPEPLTPTPAAPAESYTSVYGSDEPVQPLTGETVASAESPGEASRGGGFFQLPSESKAAPAAPAAAPPSASGTTFDSAWNTAMAQLEKEQWSDALLTLSLFYNDPALTIEQRTQLVDLLDPLAGKVIYSQEPTMEPAYTVQPGETLQAIAERVRVPVSLLQNINGIDSADSLAPGTRLKLVRGPFRAEVDLNKSELTLFLGKYYAGRFPISVGNDPPPQPGDFSVTQKQQGQEYYAPDNTRIAPLAADNPYGQWWMGLDGGFSLHGTPSTIPSHGGLGCVILSTADAADVYGILSVGSKVTLR